MRFEQRLNRATFEGFIPGCIKKTIPNCIYSVARTTRRDLSVSIFQSPGSEISSLFQIFWPSKYVGDVEERDVLEVFIPVQEFDLC